ncbi:MAG: glycosyltransferase family 39 protein [Pseudomonadota bacterium]|nr:glycosyltransferase family 39 protein [Pseudomonadota bacterium]
MTKAGLMPADAARRLAIFAVLAAVLALRLMHLSSTVQNPLNYQPGPDESYYQRFGAAVARGQGERVAEFTFMDPGYGYLLGSIFKVTGTDAFAVYFMQAVVDTATALAIVVLGGQLGRRRAGLYGALFYGVTSTAIMFSASLLKETWVAAFLIWWTVAAVAVARSDRKLAWCGFGVVCGIGIALRSTLTVIAVFSLALPWLYGRKDRLATVAPVAAGLVLALLPWALRNFQAYGSLSPLPHNGGIVLHQVYNVDNPQAAIWIPAFVNYAHPSEIWKGYAAEAERRQGRSLSPPAVDRYWRDQALAFIRENPGPVLFRAARKSLAFLSASEIPNNRAEAEERLFSPVLRWLPAPMPWLLAMGLAGLAIFAARDRRWLIVAAPIALSWLTMTFFWAEERFRFHAVPELALLSGIWAEVIVAAVRNVGRRQAAVFGLLAASVAAMSVYLGRQYPAPPVRWDHIVWGYIKMGKPQPARQIAERVAIEQPDDEPVLEALGYLDAASQDYRQAALAYQRAIELRPRSYVAHYNLAKVYRALGDAAQADREAEVAATLARGDGGAPQGIAR